MKVLIVEDDLKISTFLQSNLKIDGFIVDQSIDGLTALNKINNNIYDVIILDIMIPHLDGLELLKQVRADKINCPVLILSAKRSLQDKVTGLQVGGDDYLEKPFAYAELLARLNALVRRSTPQTYSPSLTFLDLELNTETRDVCRNGKRIFLQPREFLLLEFFMRNPEVILTKDLIINKIWDNNYQPQTNVVDVLVCRLRSKIDNDFSEKIICTERGQGYVLKKI